MTLFNLSQSIRKLNQEKKYSETLNYFKENKRYFNPAQIGANKYNVYEMIYALIETNHYQAIFSFIEQYSVVLDSKNFSYLLKKIKDKPTVGWDVVDSFCDLISVDSLDTDCISIDVERKGETKQTITKNQQQIGIVDKILNHNEKGADGFIKYGNKKSIYFRVNANDMLLQKICIGLEVIFKILPPKISKKECAINLILK